LNFETFSHLFRVKSVKRIGRRKRHSSQRDRTDLAVAIVAGVVVGLIFILGLTILLIR